jgi:hypothetical protein
MDRATSAQFSGVNEESKVRRKIAAMRLANSASD